MPDQNFSSLPKPHTTYANIIKSFLPIGDHEKTKDAVLPQSTYTVTALEIDHDNLADYRKICGFDNNSYVPPTYFAVLSQALQMNMMVKEPFPFAMLGLIHVQNSVTQYRHIKDTAIFKMAVSFANLRDHDRGKQFDFVTKVFENDELVWEGTSTYLSRQKRNKKTTTTTAKSAFDSKPVVDGNDMHEFWEVPEDIGRRYAFISGDFNLIHLHSLSAKAFGFPRAIAHGMWTKAKCLGALGDLPERFTCNVTFKLPIFLPSEVEFIAKFDNRDEQVDFGVYDGNTPKAHLIGQLADVDAKE